MPTKNESVKQLLLISYCIRLYVCINTYFGTSI